MLQYTFSSRVWRVYYFYCTIRVQELCTVWVTSCQIYRSFRDLLAIPVGKIASKNIQLLAMCGIDCMGTPSREQQCRGSSNLLRKQEGVHTLWTKGRGGGGGPRPVCTLPPPCIRYLIFLWYSVLDVVLYHKTMTDIRIPNKVHFV